MYTTKPATQTKTFAEKHGELYRKLECGALTAREYNEDVHRLNREEKLKWTQNN